MGWFSAKRKRSVTKIPAIGKCCTQWISDKIDLRIFTHLKQIAFSCWFLENSNVFLYSICAAWCRNHNQVDTVISGSAISGLRISGSWGTAVSKIPFPYTYCIPLICCWIVCKRGVWWTTTIGPRIIGFWICINSYCFRECILASICVTVYLPLFEKRWNGLAMLSLLPVPEAVSPKFQKYFSVFVVSVALNATFIAEHVEPVILKLAVHIAYKFPAPIITTPSKTQKRKSRFKILFMSARI